MQDHSGLKHTFQHVITSLNPLRVHTFQVLRTLSTSCHHPSPPVFLSEFVSLIASHQLVLNYYLSCLSPGVLHPLSWFGAISTGVKDFSPTLFARFLLGDQLPLVWRGRFHAPVVGYADTSGNKRCWCDTHKKLGEHENLITLSHSMSMAFELWQKREPHREDIGHHTSLRLSKFACLSHLSLPLSRLASLGFVQLPSFSFTWVSVDVHHSTPGTPNLRWLASSNKGEISHRITAN